MGTIQTKVTMYRSLKQSNEQESLHHTLENIWNWCSVPTSWLANCSTAAVLQALVTNSEINTWHITVFRELLMVTLETKLSQAQHCCKGDQPFQWETPKFDPLYFSNPLIFPHQNLHRSLRPAYLLMCKIWWKSVYGRLPHEKMKYNACVTFCDFPFFLAILYRKNDWTDFNTQWLIWHGFTQGNAFWGLQNLNSTFSPIFSQKNMKNYNGTYGEN